MGQSDPGGEYQGRVNLGIVIPGRREVQRRGALAVT
jgi:hypothetical protein